MKMKIFALSGLALACMAATNPVMADTAKVQIKNGGLKITQGDASIQFGGRFMLDYDNFNGVNNASNNGDSGSNSEIRRGRIFIKSHFNKVWEAKLQINVDDAGSKSDKFEDAYLKYKGFSFGNVTVGKQKESFGLEELTSSKYISTIERSMISGAFAPGRNYGVSLSGKANGFTYTGGVFSIKQDQSNQETYALTGRLTYAPVMKKGNVIHFGLAASSRDYGNNDYRIKERAEVHTATDKAAISATTNASRVNLIGLEAAGVWGSYSLQGEYQQASVNASVGGVDSNYSGYYVMGSYFLTGESRPYKNGAFHKVTPNAASGAWELVARLSDLDAVDNGFGTKTDNVTLGVNYYANASVRFMVNYVNTQVKGPSVGPQTDGDAISIRAQYIF